MEKPSVTYPTFFTKHSNYWINRRKINSANKQSRTVSNYLPCKWNTITILQELSKT